MGSYFSYLWKHTTRFRLVQSMRDRLDQPFSQTVRAIGEGLLPPVTLPDASVVIPLQYSPQPTSTAPDPSPVPNQPPTCSISGVDTFQQLIDFVYPDILTAEPTTFANRGILAPTNSSTDEINDHILGLLPARMHTLHSANTITKPVRMISTMFPLLNFSSLLTSPACLHMTSTSRLAA